MISYINAEKCTGCAICVEVCPLDTLRLDPFQETYAPCRQFCPAGVDIRGYLFYVKQGLIEKASGYLREFLPFPAITGLLCHHPCEAACARKRVDQSVNIHGIEYHIGRSSITEDIRHQPLLHAGKTAIIGSGPAGLSAAYFLRRMGYTVSVFESEGELGGSLLKEVYERRLPADVLESQLTTFREMGISFMNRWKLSQNKNIDELRDQRYSTIFLATGSDSDLPDRIARDEKKMVRVDAVTLETNVKGVFAGGGLVGGHLSLAEVIASARRASISMDRFMSRQDLYADRELKVKKVKKLPRNGIKERQRLDPQGGFTDETAVEEAGRCMSCGSVAYIAHPEDCMTCFECEVKCPSKAILVHPFKEVMPMTLALDYE